MFRAFSIQKGTVPGLNDLPIVSRSVQSVSIMMPSSKLRGDCLPAPQAEGLQFADVIKRRLIFLLRIR
jgi:hypothetical protein